MRSGDKVGELTLLHSVVIGSAGRRVWTCLCSCGVVKSIRQDALRSGSTKSCGHLQLAYAQSGEAHRQHGMSKTPIWFTWKSMLRRCREPSHKDYQNYGGRGIRVCRRWLRFENFFADMGNKPSPAYSIERRDNNLGYSLANCYWATRTEQNRNTRRNRYVMVGAVRMSLAAASEVTGIPYHTLKSRLLRGMAEEKAVLK